MKKQSRTSRKPVRRSRTKKKRFKLWRWVVVGAGAAWLMHVADAASLPSAAVNTGSAVLGGSTSQTASAPGTSTSTVAAGTPQATSTGTSQGAATGKAPGGSTGAAPTGTAPSAAPATATDATGWVVAQSFRATSAVPSGYEIHNWSLLNRQFVTDQELANTASQISNAIGLQGAKSVRRDTQAERYLEVYGELRSHTVASVFLTTFALSAGQGYSVVIVRVDNTDGSVSHFQDDVHVVTEAVKEMSLTPNLSACIQGTLDARLMGGQAKQVALQAAQSVDATTFEGVQSSDLTSLSGYTPWQPKYITTGNHKMNLQVAVHYDSFHHRTNVLVGTPIITTTY